MAANGNITTRRKQPSRVKQSKFLKDKLISDQQLEAVQSNQTTSAATINLNQQADRDHLQENLKIKKIRNGLIVEQNVTYTPGANKPVFQVDCRLTTAVRGLKQNDDLTESAYLLRLEMIKLSPNLKVAGFQLGPWQVTALDLDKGSIYLAQPFWSGFQPVAGLVSARLLITDLSRHRLVDLPWQTHAVCPGADPYNG